MSNPVAMRITNIYLNLPLSNKDVDGDFYDDIYVQCGPKQTILIGETLEDLEDFLEKSGADMNYIFDIHQITKPIIREMRMSNRKHSFVQLAQALQAINNDDFVFCEDDTFGPKKDLESELKIARRLPFEPNENWKQRFMKLVRPRAVISGLKLDNPARMMVEPVVMRNCTFTLTEYFAAANISLAQQARFIDVVKGNQRMAKQLKKMEEIFNEFN